MTGLPEEVEEKLKEQVYRLNGKWPIGNTWTEFLLSQLRAAALLAVDHERKRFEKLEKECLQDHHAFCAEIEQLRSELAALKQSVGPVTVEEEADLAWYLIDTNDGMEKRAQALDKYVAIRVNLAVAAANKEAADYHKSADEEMVAAETELREKLLAERERHAAELAQVRNELLAKAGEADGLRNRLCGSPLQGEDEVGCKHCGPWACKCEHFRQLEEEELKNVLDQKPRPFVIEVTL